MEINRPLDSSGNPPVDKDGIPLGPLIAVPTGLNYSIVGQNYLLRASCPVCPTCALGNKLLIEVNRVTKTDRTIASVNKLNGKVLGGSASTTAKISVTDGGWVDLFAKADVGCDIPP
jgi:hypothetical protein